MYIDFTSPIDLRNMIKQLMATDRMNKKQPSPPPVAVFRGDKTGWHFNINSCEQFSIKLFEMVISSK